MADRPHAARGASPHAATTPGGHIKLFGADELDGLPPEGGVVAHYLQSLVGHDWAGVASCLTPDVVRMGPFGDNYAGRDTYVAFLSALLPNLAGYAMRVDRLVVHGRLVLVELTETVELEGAPVDTPEALVFDLDDEGTIARIAIYIQRLGSPPTDAPRDAH